MNISISREEAERIAKQAFASVDKQALADYLDAGGLLEAALADKLWNAPAQTIAELQQLPDAANCINQPSLGEGLAAQAPERSVPASDDREALKARLRRHLKQVGKTTRKQICEALHIESVYIYNRLMADMKGELRARGQKAKRTYTLK